jgi:alpha-amylase
MKQSIKNTTYSLFVVILCIGACFAGTPEQWKSRTIYQLLTDRFARSDGTKTQCSNLGNYCGGGYKGIMNNLDYISGMGFDAIWISPIV